MSGEADPGPPLTTPDQFQGFVRRLLSVPKKELDRKLAQQKAAKKKSKRR